MVGYNRLVRQIVRGSVALRMGRLRAFRRSLGLPPTREDLFLDFGRRNGADRIFGLWSPCFAPPQPDQPKNLDVVGFPFFVPRDAERRVLDPRVSAFLAAGTPPLVFTLGSFVPEVSGAFYDVSLRVARTLCRRAILLAGPRDAARLTERDGPEVLVCAQAPHSLLFPHVGCVVHHGGIGTTAEGLRAGCPQVVVPFFGDQPDHGARVERLGVGVALSLARYDERRAVGALSSAMKRGPNAVAFAAALASERGVEAVADWAEDAAARRAAA